MKIGLIDVDGHNFPNIPLMKLSAWHKKRGDHVEWYSPMFSGHMDKVYMSKVFSFTPDYEYYINAEEVIRGGTGYAIDVDNGREIYFPGKDGILPDEIEHIYPDYDLYPELTKDTAYGFLTRGCPRSCGFCHTTQKDGCQSHKVADLHEFWNGQKEIVLLDQNILACQEHDDLMGQLVECGSGIEFNGGLDIRLMSEKDAEHIRKMKVKMIHFAWDIYGYRRTIVPKLKEFKDITGWDRHKVMVYVLVNYGSTIAQDLERIYTIREIGFAPYVMIYNKASLPDGHILKRMQRWVNLPWVFRTTERFEDFETLSKEQRDLILKIGA